MRAYDLVLSESAAYFLFGLPGGQGKRIASVLDRLKSGPFQPGDLTEPDNTGRPHLIILFEDWPITFRVDLAFREIRVVRIETVED